MKKLSSFMVTLGAVTLSVALLITAIDYVASDQSFYEAEYSELGIAETTGLNRAELSIATQAIINYITGKTDTLEAKITIFGHEMEAFTDSTELAHMKDVRDLFMMAVSLRGVLLAAFGAIIALALVFGRLRISKILGYMALGLIIGIILIAATGVFAYTQFDTFWPLFHKLLFTNDLWLLDPSTSLIINMLPSEFFEAAAMRVLYAYALWAGLILVACVAGMLMMKRADKARGR